MDTRTVSHASPRQKTPSTVTPVRLKTAELRSLCLEAGAGDCGFVELGRTALDFERADILAAYPRTRTLVALAFPLNPENIRSQARQMSSAEVHDATAESAHTARSILRRLNTQGVRGVAVPADFPMDMGRFPGKIWNVSHKIVAVQAGLGHMGVNRLVIHPVFGNFIRLTTLLIDAELDAYGAPLADSPCIHCGLCEAVCPVGAIGADKPFNLMACMTHAYRDNVVGFMDLLDATRSTTDIEAFRQRFKDREVASMWQSLMYKMNYRCGYCMAVCPAGQVGGLAWQGRKKAFMDEVFRPLKNRKEDVYVAPGSQAEARALKNPNKEVRRVVPLVERKA
ncbi:MAG TPA: 4Fe-4S double cluster binding domain-containing protein [Humidesulfovibrio sp.]|uniref:4Fe-4S binding protein n=1 Tax=Humidesulfovibrio sp. TaxID=2910988 RepID=UPI002C6CD681|nr:4Fe-4S double cluster binding domain-containing protein [Humidesulfovibrio sp.]HWR05220.1 4Fe-4S double cluster binding domain-containing protein [Humidesulfovibrio sp.]